MPLLFACNKVRFSRIMAHISQIKKPVFKVTRPYLNLSVKPRIVSGFLDKNIILCILKGAMPFKMHKIIFFSRKKDMCAYHTKYFQTRYLKHIHFLFGLIRAYIAAIMIRLSISRLV